MSRQGRTVRFPAHMLRMLLATKPFPLELWVAATSPALCVRIGNEPARGGQSQALAALKNFLIGIRAFSSGFCQIWSVDEAIYIETELEYRAVDASNGIIPASVIARTTHGVVHDLRIYLDPTPLYRPQYPVPHKRLLGEE